MEIDATSILTSEEVLRLTKEVLANGATQDDVELALVELSKVKVNHVVWMLWEQGMSSIKMVNGQVKYRSPDET